MFLTGTNNFLYRKLDVQRKVIFFYTDDKLRLGLKIGRVFSYLEI